MKFFLAVRAYVLGYGWSFGVYINYKGTQYGVGWNPEWCIISFHTYHYSSVKLRVFSI